MTAATESPLLGAGPLLMWGLLLVFTVAATVFAVRRHAVAGTLAETAGTSRAELVPPGGLNASDRSDPLFWDLFMGSVVAVPAILIPALESPWSGVLLAAMGGAAGIASYRYSPRIMAWQESRRQRRLELPQLQAAEAQHQALLARWRRYELDPAVGIDHPAITDVRTPETSELVRAMREAEQLRTAAPEGYAAAVVRLVQALAAAEKAAGIPVSER